jgi:hypothetical protein
MLLHVDVLSWQWTCTYRILFVNIHYQKKGRMKTYIYVSVFRLVCIANCLWHKCSVYHGKPPETVFMSSSIDWWCRNRLPSANVTVPVRTWLLQWTNLLCWHVSDYLQVVSNILNCNRFPSKNVEVPDVPEIIYLLLNNKHNYLLRFLFMLLQYIIP